MSQPALPFKLNTYGMGLTPLYICNYVSGGLTFDVRIKSIHPMMNQMSTLTIETLVLVHILNTRCLFKQRLYKTPNTGIQIKRKKLT